MADHIIWYVLGAVRARRSCCARLQLRLQLSRAKHRSLAGPRPHGAALRRLVPFYEYDEERSSFAPTARRDEVAAPRRAGFMRLAAVLCRAQPEEPRR